MRFATESDRIDGIKAIRSRNQKGEPEARHVFTLITRSGYPGGARLHPGRRNLRSYFFFAFLAFFAFFAFFAFLAIASSFELMD